MSVVDVKIGSVGVEQPLINIDRRQCHRVVPMKVLVLGLGRTGTSSIRAAFFQLGISGVYHMHEMLAENPSDWELWNEALVAKFEGKGNPYGKEDFDKLLGHCMAISDWPAICFADELVAAYPEAKVILTVRDNPDVWLKSMLSTIWPMRYMVEPPSTITQRIMQTIAPLPPGIAVLAKLFEHTFLRDVPNLGRQSYLDHCAYVRKLVPKEQFLEYNVKQGWDPLCEFLDCKVPDMAFPKVNDTQAFVDFEKGKRRDGLMQVLGKYLKVMSAVFLVGGGFWLALQ